MSRERNPEARCVTCPYWREGDSPGTLRLGQCWYSQPKENRIDGPECNEQGWCGKHPDFWQSSRADYVEQCSGCGGELISIKYEGINCAQFCCSCWALLQQRHLKDKAPNLEDESLTKTVGNEPTEGDET